jgi:GT2 family glycosyltransferase
LLVVDSAPAGDMARSVAAAAGARYVATSRPGLDVARNLALQTARGEIIAFIDDDTVAAPDWIEAMRASFSDPSAACVTGRVLPLELRTEAQRLFEEYFSFERGAEPMRFTRSTDQPRLLLNPWRLGTGCNMAFRRRVFDLVGPFDEALDVGTPTGGGGDIDIFRRLLRAGLAVHYNPDAVIYHQHRTSHAELLRQVWGYGKSYTALMTKSVFVERDMAAEAWSLALYRLRQQVQKVGRRLLKRTGPPLILLLVETAGHLVGPLAFLQSTRRLQRERQDVEGRFYAQPRQVD